MTSGTGSETLFKIWQGFCRLICRVFYRKVEVLGNIPQVETGGVIVCANHVNALVDPVVVQAATSRKLRPLARSGLFHSPFAPILKAIGAVPIFRRGDPGVNTSQNLDSFSKCYELLAQNEALIIFPEGQSHGDPHLHQLKTGAARMALGAISVNQQVTVIPAGLTFGSKRRFRSRVLVNFGSAIDLSVGDSLAPREKINLITQRISSGLTAVTLNAGTWEEIDLVNRLERFFSIRHGKYHARSLSQRFKALQRLIDGQKLLQVHEPRRVRALVSKLKAFENLRKCLGIQDYHLTIHYKPLLIISYLLRTAGILIFVLPIALIGVVNSFIPWYITSRMAPRFAKGPDQMDTARILVGSVAFLGFWSLQSFGVYLYGGLGPALIYLLIVVICSCIAVFMRSELKRIYDNIRVFFLFLRKREIKGFVQHKRQELEQELASLVRIAKRLSAQETHSHESQ